MPVLSALVQGVTAGLLRDVVMVDSGSTDDTAAIADAAGCAFLHSLHDEGLRLRQGAGQARGSWLMFLSPQSILDEGWVREVGNFMETAERRGQSDRAAATFRLAVDGYGFGPRLGEAMAAARLALLGLPGIGQGLVISRKHYERLGGHAAGVKAHRRLVSRIGRRHIHLLRAHVLLPHGPASLPPAHEPAAASMPPRPECGCSSLLGTSFTCLSVNCPLAPGAPCA